MARCSECGEVAYCPMCDDDGYEHEISEDAAIVLGRVETLARENPESKPMCAVNVDAVLIYRDRKAFDEEEEPIYVIEHDDQQELFEVLYENKIDYD